MNRKASLPGLRLNLAIATISFAAIILYVIQWLFGDRLVSDQRLADIPLFLAFAVSVPLLYRVAKRAARLELTADLLAAVSIVAALILGEYLAGTIVVFMLSGGEALEAYAIRKASFALDALAKRLPSVAHLKNGQDIPLDAVKISDEIVVHPHEICAVDGVVLEGRSSMNEAYLTGEPYVLPKAIGSTVLSGAVNGEGLLVVRAEKLASDSRYTRIMEVMRDAEERRPQLRRLGDRIGGIYTMAIFVFAIAAGVITGSPDRFLSILVVATPCPLIIGIPIAVIGSVSLAAHRGIIIKDPAVLERLDACRIAIFDKTGTLTYGQPKLVEFLVNNGICPDEMLRSVASLERYSRHPLATPIVQAAFQKKLELLEASQVSEQPGDGLSGVVNEVKIRVTGRNALLKERPDLSEKLPVPTAGLECIVLWDGDLGATLRFRDAPREDGRLFVSHLGPKHGFERVILLSGDRLDEVKFLAESVGIKEVYASQTPEQKLDLVRVETRESETIFMGDGINDAPALTAATVGIAFGQASDVTSEAASAVVLDNSLSKVDELFHIGRRMRSIALQSGIGGLSLSLIGVGFAAVGMLPPVAGAITQEVIDLVAIFNAIRTTFPPRVLSDIE